MSIIVYKNSYFDKEKIQTMITLFVWNYVVFRQLWLAKGFDEPSKLHFWKIAFVNVRYEDIYEGINESKLFIKHFDRYPHDEEKRRKIMEDYLNNMLEEYHKEHLKYRRRLVSKKLKKL